MFCELENDIREALPNELSGWFRDNVGAERWSGICLVKSNGILNFYIFFFSKPFHLSHRSAVQRSDGATKFLMQKKAEEFIFHFLEYFNLFFVRYFFCTFCLVLNPVTQTAEVSSGTIAVLFKD